MGVSVGIFILKTLIVFWIALGMKFSVRAATIAAVTLAQIGEFSFVLAQVGFSVGLLDQSIFQTFLSASIFTMVVSPPLIAYAPTIADRTQSMLPFDRKKTETSIQSLPPHSDHVIIVGYGLNGQNVVRVLRETGIPYVVVESDGELVGRLRKDDPNIVFGDVTRKEILAACFIERSKVIVFAISDPQATRTAVRLARLLHPEITIIVRTRHVKEVDELIHLGANEVIPEEFETSIEIFTRVLDHYHIPRNVVNAQIQIIRDENYSVLRGIPQTSEGFDRVADLLSEGTTETFLVTGDSRAASATAGDLNIAGKTGVTLLAIVRNEKAAVSPPPEYLIQAGDILVLIGNHAQIDKAFEYLSASRKEKS
ncbi:MAG TPA: NAD-binding protein, partial [Bacteroidota bacterium]